MSNKNSNEELQSRREFFKKAAKAALPVLGAMVFANTPLWGQTGAPRGGFFQAQRTDCQDCTGSCMGGCQGSCKGTCQGSCQGSNTAGNPNGGSCNYGCTNSCAGGCTGTCYRTCNTSCSGYSYY